LREQFERDDDAAMTRLQTQGLTPGSEAYNEEMRRIGDAQNRARTDVLMAGGQEQSRLFGMNEQARAAAMQELLTERNQPINEISALMSGGQVSVPSAVAPYRQSIEPAPVGDYINQNYQNELANYQSGMSGLFGIGSSLVGGLFGLSDKRAKKNLKP